MSAHTPGRLVVTAINDDFVIGNGLPAGQGRYAVATARREPDARRLAACWNACEGFETDLLVNIDMMGDTLKQRFEGMQVEVRRVDADSRAIEANYEAARALLVEVIADAGIASHIDACNRAQTFLDARDDKGVPA